MYNFLIIGIYAPFCVVTAIILGIELFRRFKRREDYFFMLLCFSALGWYIVNIWGLLATTDEVAVYCINLMLIFVSIITPTLLLFIIKFYKYEVPFKIPRYAFLALYIIPVITSILAITSPFHRFLTTQLDIISLSPLREMSIAWGPWFWVHTVYSYILSLIIIMLIISQHIKVAHFYRLPSTMMVVGVSITLLGNLVTLFQIIPPVIEPTLITMSLSLILFSLAIYNNNNSKFVRFSKAHIYNYLADYILVLDEKDQIIDHNDAASEWFASRNISLTSTTLQNISEELLKKGEIVQRDPLDEGNRGIDIWIHDSMFATVLNQRTFQMKDARNERIGKIVVFSDVTENRMLIERLEKKAGMDSLTGLPNHMAYKGVRERLDDDNHLPLAVIMGDANNLKSTNDNLGHAYGDLLLENIASVLEETCPSDGFVARIGGDEFVFLLPHRNYEQASVLVKKIEDRFALLTELPFPVSVTFGIAVKETATESLDHIIEEADQRMYKQKKELKQKLTQMAESKLTS